MDHDSRSTDVPTGKTMQGSHDEASNEPLPSYSQNAEDVRLWRVLQDLDDGFYVDVGAGHPNLDSVTQLFYERGWSGINIEPGPHYADLAENRPRDVNLRVAVGA